MFDVLVEAERKKKRWVLYGSMSSIVKERSMQELSV